MEKLFTLLELQRRAQEAGTQQAFEHLVVNETHKLVPYAQAIFWTLEGTDIVLTKVSGNAVLDDKSPYALNIKAWLRSELATLKKPVITLGNLENNRNVVVLNLMTAAEGLLAGVWIESAKPFQEPELHLLEELAITYGHALALLEIRQRKDSTKTFFKKIRRSRKYMILAALALIFFPVRLTISGPAEIIARDADIVTIPYDGMLEKIEVQPGDQVTKGQVLARMENSALAAQMDNAAQELKAIELSVARLSRQSLAAPDKKGDLTAAEAEIVTKRIQYEYAESLQEKSELRATRDGVAVFSDTHALQGHPVRTGERIMMIADTSEYDVLVRVPVEAMLPVKTGQALSFYLNVSPLNGYEATISSIGYQASPDPDGLLTYKIHATPRDADNLRIGWKGTARIYGSWTVLSYAILRQPLAALRRMTGL